MLSTMRLANSYNALGWRTSRAFDDSQGTFDGLDQKRVYLYGADWRMLEERIDTDVTTDSDSIGGAADDTDWVSQQFWGLRYIDDAVGKRVDRTGAGDFVDNSDCTYWYQLTDTQFSVGVVLDSAGYVYERVSYDAYGQARHRFAADCDGNGQYDNNDNSGFFTHGTTIDDTSNYHADFDVNCDGAVNIVDIGLLAGSSPVAVPDGWIGEPDSADGPDNSIGYAGYVFNHEREDYLSRFRVYAPDLGRWRQRDPVGYSGGGNLYENVHSSPVVFIDTYGLTPGTFGQHTSSESDRHESGLPPCVDDKGCPITMTFDGNNLTSSTGEEIPAVSGKPVTEVAFPGKVTRSFNYSPSRQGIRNVGPIPGGDYYITTDHEDSSQGTNNPNGRGSSRHRRNTYRNGRGAWGDYSWPVSPELGTNTNDSNGKPRNGFFIHGGTKPGSAGCIDCYGGGDKALHKLMNKIRKNNKSPCYVKVTANYSGRSNDSITQTAN